MGFLPTGISALAIWNLVTTKLQVEWQNRQAPWSAGQQVSRMIQHVLPTQAWSSVMSDQSRVPASHHPSPSLLHLQPIHWLQGQTGPSFISSAHKSGFLQVAGLFPMQRQNKFSQHTLLTHMSPFLWLPSREMVGCSQMSICEHWWSRRFGSYWRPLNHTNFSLEPRELRVPFLSWAAVHREPSVLRGMRITLFSRAWPCWMSTFTVIASCCFPCTIHYVCSSWQRPPFFL